MRSHILTIALGAILLAAATPAHAQWRRNPVTVSFGIGYGQANVSCDNCVNGSGQSGITAFAELQGRVSRALRLGLGFDSWWHSSGGTTEQMSDVTLSARVFPVDALGLFLSGGIGLSNYRTDTFPSVSGTGWGYSVGLGYNLPFGRRTRLTPVARYVYGDVGDLGMGGSSFATNWKQHFFNLGVGLTLGW